MGSICGASCEECRMKDECRGCEATCGSPFGGKCIAAEYIKTGGKAAYDEFKAGLLAEVNALLRAEGITEGKAQLQLSVARTMLADGMSYDIIMKYTGLSQEQIAQLAAQDE